MLQLDDSDICNPFIKAMQTKAIPNNKYPITMSNSLIDSNRAQKPIEVINPIINSRISDDNNIIINSNDVEQINILFKYQNYAEIRKINMQCILDEKISNLIKRFRIKIDDFDSLLVFVFNGHKLDSNLTIAQARLRDRSVISVLNFQNVQGG